MAHLYCEVALPVPLRTTFTYAIPATLAGEVTPGMRVLAPFRNRAMVGVVMETSAQPPAGAAKQKLRGIQDVLDAQPALTPALVELARWMARYYVAPIGEVVRAMLPPAVDVRQQRYLHLTDAGRARRGELDSRPVLNPGEVDDHAVLQLFEVEGRPLRADKVAALPGASAAVLRLRRRGALAEVEQAHRRKKRMQRVIAWNALWDASTNPAPVTGAEQRVRSILTEERGPLPLPRLLEEAKVSRSVVERLERAGALKSWDEPVEFEDDLLESDFTPPSNILNPGQQRAVNEISRWMDTGEFAAGLLYGVTGSGKTEVYLRAVDEALNRNRTALVLVPEIALTLWIGRLLRARLGDTVAILHSSLHDVERAAEWWRVRRGEARVVVGTRSAVFAPLERPGVIVVDEEQETSYKQEESPRYHGRDTAVMRAKLERGVALLGSATPSLESFYNAREGKYRLLELESRIENRPMARVDVVDLRDEFRRTHRAAALSSPLHEAITARLEAGTQALVLINRRGYSWFQLCRSCGATVMCENCSISLTYHKKRDRLACHYCGFSLRVPKRCPKCDSEYIYFVGEGAEQVEEQLRGAFPSARIARLDRDTARSRRAYTKVLGSFARGEMDILVGTQMVAKGHDFQRVTLVGVVSADLSLGLPDFRAAERTFQLLTQVAGRAGRGELPGEVKVQTYYPEHYAIEFASRQDYRAFFEKELHFRRMMHYPPFTALANVLVRDRNLDRAIRWSRALEGYFAPHEKRGLKALGPASAPLARLRGEYRFQFLLKSPKRVLLAEVLAGCLDFCAKKEIPESAVVVDCDPVSLM